MARLDSMIEAVIGVLCAQSPASVASIPTHLVENWPDAPILDLVLAIATGCDAVESMFDADGPSAQNARAGWRTAALLATDLRAMQALGMAHAKASDLTAYWQKHDPYFIRMAAS
jgi:hypothetical protein